MADSHQYVDNNSTNWRKSVKQNAGNLYSETAETCTLRGPQPDPKTGLVPCGCGGKAGFHYSVIVDNDCYVECGICGGHTMVALSEDKARDAWNTAMGYTAPSRQGAIGPDASEMDSNGDEGAKE